MGHVKRLLERQSDTGHLPSAYEKWARQALYDNATRHLVARYSGVKHMTRIPNADANANAAAVVPESPAAKMSDDEINEMLGLGNY